MSSTCSVSATPYQTAETPFRYESSIIEIKEEPENRPVMHTVTNSVLKFRPPTKYPLPPAAFLRAIRPIEINKAV